MKKILKKFQRNFEFSRTFIRSRIGKQLGMALDNQSIRPTDNQTRIINIRYDELFEIS